MTATAVGNPPQAPHVPPLLSGSLLIAALAAMSSPVFIDGRTGKILTFNLFAPPVSTSGVLAIHISAFVVPALAGVLLLTRIARGRPLPRNVGTRFITGLIIAFTISMAVGVIVGRSGLAFVFYVQTVIPLIAYLIGVNARLPVERLVRIIVGGIAVTTLLVLITILRVGPVEPRPLIRVIVAGIPQYRNFFPAMLLVGITLALNFRHLRPRLFTATLVGFALVLPYLWSRTGVGMIAISLGVSGLLYVRNPRRAHQHKAGFVIGASLAVAAVLAALVTSSVIADRVDEVGGVVGGPGDLRRLELARTAIGYVMDNPVTGRSFLPESELRRDPDDVVSTFRAHNQYLDYALKGGVLGALLFIGLLVTSARTGWRLWRFSPHQGHRRFGGSMLAIIAATAFGGMFHLLFVQAWTAALLFFLLGYGASRTSVDEASMPGSASVG